MTLIAWLVFNNTDHSCRQQSRAETAGCREESMVKPNMDRKLLVHFVIFVVTLMDCLNETQKVEN